MKRSTVVLSLLLGCGIFSLAQGLRSQDKPEAKPPAKDTAKGPEPKPAGKDQAAPAEADMKDVMKKWMEFATPGLGHKKLEPLVGKWDYQQKIWMQPDSPPTESSGKTEVRWIMGNRFVQMESTGKFLDKPFSSVWLLGFDNFKKKYVSCYFDNIGTGLYPAEGSAGPGDRAITLVGHMDDWYTGEHDRAYTYVIRSVNKDKWTFEMTDLASGAKSMEVAYNRQK
jgi:hypothetical protein